MSALSRNDVSALLGERSKGLVLSHAHGRLMCPGDDGNRDSRGNVAAGCLASTGRQGFDVPGHRPEKPALAPAFANQANRLRWKLGKFTKNAFDGLLCLSAKSAHNLARHSVVAALQEPKAKADHAQRPQDAACARKPDGSQQLPALRTLGRNPFFRRQRINQDDSCNFVSKLLCIDTQDVSRVRVPHENVWSGNVRRCRHFMKIACHPLQVARATAWQTPAKTWPVITAG